MIENAKAKISEEVKKEEKNPYVKVISEFLLKHLENHPEDSEKILATDKTILKSLEEMAKEAKKKKFGSCAMLTDEEGYAIVLKYFGIETKVDVKVDAPEEKKQESKVDFDINLDDLF